MDWREPRDGRISLDLAPDELNVVRLSLLEGIELGAERFRAHTGWPRDYADELEERLGDAVTDPRWRDLTVSRPVHEPPREPRELAFYLFARFRRISAPATDLKITAWAVASSIGARFEYTDPDVPEPVDVTMACDAADLLYELRRSTYETGIGGWYNAVVTINMRIGDPRMELDFDGRPAFPWPISEETCRKDLELFPRKPEHIPAWMGLTTRGGTAGGVE